MALIYDTVTPGEYQYYFGIYSISLNSGQLLGPLVGGALADLTGGSYGMLLILPVAIICFIVILKYYPNHPNPDVKRSMDFPSIILFLVSFGAFSLATNLIDIPTWATVLLLATCVLAATLFVINEKRSDNPLLPVNLFKIKTFTIAIILLCLANTSVAISNSYILLYSQSGLGLSTTISGTLGIPKTIAVWGMSLIGRKIRFSNRRKPFLLLLGIIMGVNLLFLGLGASFAVNPLPHLYASMFLFGIGEGLVYMVLVQYLQSDIPSEKKSMSASTQSFFMALSYNITTATFGLIKNLFGGDIRASFPVMCFTLVVVALLYIVIAVIFVKDDPALLKQEV